jgi:hypothetical protein
MAHYGPRKWCDECRRQRKAAHERLSLGRLFRRLGRSGRPTFLARVGAQHAFRTRYAQPLMREGMVIDTRMASVGAPGRRSGAP